VEPGNCLRVKQAGHGANLSPASGAEFENDWILTCTHPVC